MTRTLPLYKRFLFALLLVSGSLLVLFLIAELCVRIFLPQTDLIRWQAFHPRYGSFHKKNHDSALTFQNTDVVMTVETNSLGLRDREYDFSDRSAKRVLLLGDSFTFGFGLNTESIFDTRLETLLNTRTDKVFVINTGVSNWGTLQEFLFARDHFELFRPDIVVLSFCGNDKGDIDWFRHHAVKGFEGGVSVPGKRVIRRHSHLYRYLSDQWKVLSAIRAMDGKTEQADKGNGRGDVFVDNQTASALTEEDWRETLGIIREFHGDYMRFNPDGLMLVQATAPWDERIREKLKSLDNGKDLLYVDLYEETRLIPQQERRLPYDSHWSEKMHTVSARELYRVITEQMKGRLDQTPPASPPIPQPR